MSLPPENRSEEDWMIARTAAEFGFKGHEKGWNLEMTLSQLAMVFNGAFQKRAPYQGEPGLEKQEDWS
jgi:hypothetical protein